MPDAYVTSAVAVLCVVLTALIGQLMTTLDGSRVISRLESEVNIYRALSFKDFDDFEGLSTYLMLRYRILADLKKVAFRGFPEYSHPWWRLFVTGAASGVFCVLAQLAGCHWAVAMALGVVVGFLAGFANEKVNVKRFEKLIQKDKYDKLERELAEKYGLSDDGGDAEESAERRSA